MNFEEVDLHLHSFYSDGALSPFETLVWAKGTGAKIVSICDHDGVPGQEEGRIAASELNLDYVNGIELSSYLDKIKYKNIDGKEIGIGLHILGYGIDTDNKSLLKVISYLKKYREDRNAKMLEALGELGMPLSLEELTFREDQDFIGRPTMARAMLKKGYIEKFEDAFGLSGVFGNPLIRKIHKERLETKEAIKTIIAAGGVPVLAHPAQIKGTDNFEELIKVLIDYGIQGIEANYGRHTVEQRKYYAEIADKHNLIVTSGSDYHGISGEI
ncbi:MAG: PHP domain-containing protein [Anaerovoracaceae bacterium]